MDLNQFCDENLKSSKESKSLRALRNFSVNQNVILNDTYKPLINFSSNDYLGFRDHPIIKEAANAANNTYGTGTGASRLVSGNSKLISDLELVIANFKETESALVFSSGYAANIGVLQALMQKGDLIICDKLNHASIFDGCRLSEASFRTFAHKNYAELIEILKEKRKNYRHVLIVTDSVFSMDGDLADLTALSAIKNEFDSWLMIDEAHATGVIGKNGRGLAHDLGLTKSIDIHMGTLSKAIGSQGGFIAGSHSLIQYLINHARSFIYSTGLAPSCCGAAKAAFEILLNYPAPITNLKANGELWRKLTLLKSESPIYPIIIGDTEKTLLVSDRFYQQGFFLQAIRPPTVPIGTSRLRVTITASHTKEQIERLANCYLQLIKNL